MLVVSIALAGCADDEPAETMDAEAPVEAEATPDAPLTLLETSVGGPGAATGETPFEVPEGNWTRVVLEQVGMPTFAGALRIWVVDSAGSETVFYDRAGILAGGGAGLASPEEDHASYAAGGWKLAWENTGFAQVEVVLTVS